MSRQNRGLVIRCLVLGITAIAVTTSLGYYFLDEEPPLAPQKPAVVDAEAVIREVDFLPSGLVIPDSGPPKGWSHLIIKSKPRVDDADRSKVSRFQVHMAELIFTVNVADVVADMTEDGQKDYALTRLGLGLGANLQDKDTTLVPEDMTRARSRELGAMMLRLNLGRTLVDEVRKHQKEARLVAATRRTALLDTPVFARRPMGHRKSIIRHYHRVDAETGELTVATWLIDLDNTGSYAQAVGPVQVLPANMVSDAVMRVDTNEINRLGIPNERAFAVVSGPIGEKKIPFPSDEIAELAGQARMTLEEYQKLIQALDAKID